MAFTLTVSAKRLNDIAAHQPAVGRELKTQAELIASRASAILAGHRNTGDSEINVTHGTLDYFVNLDDTRGQRAAAAIEFGHMTPTGRFVEGVHALTGGLG